MKNNNFIIICLVTFVILFQADFLCVYAGEIHDAVANGQTELVKRIVMAEPDLVNSRDSENRTPLYFAFTEHNHELALWLIENGANPSEINVNKFQFYNNSYWLSSPDELYIVLTPMQLAAYFGWNDVVILLRKKGAVLSNYSRFSPLLLSVCSNKIMTAKLLIAMGANVDECIPYIGHSPIVCAALADNGDMVRLLVRNGAKVDIVDRQYITPLAAAVKNKNRKMIDYLLSNGADINFPNFVENTDFCIPYRSISPIASAVLVDDTDLVKELVLKGARCDIKSVTGEGLLHQAVNKDSFEIVKILIKNGADPNEASVPTKTYPIHKVKSLKMAQILVNSGADVNVKDIGGQTLLHKTNNQEIVEFCIKQGADINLMDMDGNTPLHTTEEPGVIKVLIEAGAKINEKNYEGDTPLMNLMLKRLGFRPEEFDGKAMLECAGVFIDHRADVNCRSWKGKTALLYLCKNYYFNDDDRIAYRDKIIKLLLENGADCNICDVCGNLPLHEVLTSKEYRNAVKYLLDAGSEVNTINCDGETPLHKCDNLSVVKMLVNKGANVKARDKEGCSPLINIWLKDYEVVKFLVSAGADINALDEEGNSPLFYLSPYDFWKNEILNNTGIFDKYKKLGAKLYLKNKKGQSLLFLSNNPYISEYLIKNGLKPCDKDIYGRTSLFYCTDKNTLLLLKNYIPDSKSRGGVKVEVCKFTARLAGNYVISSEIKIMSDQVIAANPDQERDNLEFSFINVILNKDSRKVEEMLKKDPYLANLYWNNLDKRVNNYSGYRKALNIAVSMNNYEMVELLVKYGADVNSRIDTLPIIVAFNKHNIDMVCMLVELGAELTDKENPDVECHILSRVVLNRNIDFLIRLLSKGADPTCRGSEIPPIHAAVMNEDIPMINYLLYKGADINVKDREGNSLLNRRFSFNTFFINFLILKGLNVNYQDHQGFSLLHMAVSKEREDLACICLQNGANVNAQNHKGETPLHFAKNPGIATILIKAGADLTITDNMGRTPDQCADNPVMIEFYKKLIPQPTENKSKVTPLHWACYETNLYNVDYYINHGMNVNEQDINGLTPLHYIVKYGECYYPLAITELLLKNGAKPNIKDKNGMTPLHYASLKHDETDKLKLLIKYGGNPNIQDKLGNTPLHYLVKQTDLDFDIGFMIKAGANPCIRNNAGVTPVDLAKKRIEPVKSHLIKLLTLKRQVKIRSK